ncbi:MAG: SOS response-associated peptidase, partial [Pontimonas sp.]|nr:SOS response-associated peptidase [Pontimonas sp.]
TRESAGILAPVHDRMPIALEPQDYGRWLDQRGGDGAALIAEVSETAAHTADHWDHYEVSPLRGDGPHLGERKREQ